MFGDGVVIGVVCDVGVVDVFVDIGVVSDGVVDVGDGAVVW